MKKNIVHAVTRRYMMKNKKRTLFSFIGIMFMVMLLTCVFIGKDTVYMYLEDVLAYKQGRWEVNLYDLSKEKLNELESLDYIVDLGVSAHIGMADFKESKNQSKPYFNIKAYSEKDFDFFNIELVSGRLPENDKEAVISETAVNENPDISEGFKITGELFSRRLTSLNEKGVTTTFPFQEVTLMGGETIDISEDFPYMDSPDEFREDKKLLGKNADITIVGIIKKPFFENDDSAGYTVITFLDPENLPADTNFNASVTWEKSSGNAMAVFDKFYELAGKKNVEENRYFTAIAGKASDKELQIVAVFAETFFYIITAAAAIILIYNLFNLSYIERCKYLGMLSSVGATAKQKRSSVYYEIFSLLVIALPIGFILGTGVVILGMKLLSPNIISIVNASMMSEIKEIPVSLVVKPSGAALVILMSIVTVITSALFPAFKISRKGAVEGIRGSEHISCRKHRTNRHAFRKNGAEKMLADSYFGRQKRKKFGMCISVIVLIVVFTGTYYLSSSAIAISDAYIKDDSVNIVLPQKNEAYLEINYYNIQNSDEEMKRRADFIEDLKKNPDVIKVKNENSFSAFINGDYLSSEYIDAYRVCIETGYDKKEADQILKNDLSSLHAFIITPDDDVLHKIADKANIDPSLLFDEHSVIAVNNAVISTNNIHFDTSTGHTKYFNIDNITEKKAGEKIRFEHPCSEENHTLDVNLAGIIDYDIISDYIMLSESDTPVFFTTADTAKYINMTVYGTEYHSAFDDYYIVEFSSTDCSTLQKLKENAETDDMYVAIATQESIDNRYISFPQAVRKIIIILLGCFVALVSVICLMNMINTAQGRVAERKKDFAVLKSVGMTNKQIEKSLIIETLKILVLAYIISAVLCVPIMLLISKNTNYLIGHIDVPFPVIPIMLAITVTTFFIIIVTLNSFKKFKNMDIIKSIVSETM